MFATWLGFFGEERSLAAAVRADNRKQRSDTAAPTTR
jgi:hypothetical protein